MQEWQLIPHHDINMINSTGEVIHQLAQLVAMFGHGYLHHENDDSHNTPGWDSSSKSLTSHSIAIPHTYMSINLEQFDIKIFQGRY